MTAYASAEEAIPGDLDGLDAAADTISAAAEGAVTLTSDMRTAVDSTEDFWASPSGTGYRVAAQKQIGAVGMLVSPLDTTSQAFETLGRELRGARGTVDRALVEAVALGMSPGDLVGNPWMVVRFLAVNPQHTPTVAGLLGDVASARVAAGAAHTAFVTSLDGVRDGIDAADERLLGSRRDPDERGGRRIDEDDRRGREPGGRGNGSDLDNDWAGRAILERYLRGGDDWTVVDDPDWSQYMMDNQTLREQLSGPVDTQAQRALDEYLVTGSERREFDDRFPVEVENGEGIVGYQYLHGTNRDVGDFGFEGSTQVRPRADGTYEVTIEGGYTWNDRIDPNPQYETDQRKGTLAEILTLGQADPYDMHITWHAPSSLVLDANGDVISRSGYPSK